jgi:hypothetical protein
MCAPPSEGDMFVYDDRPIILSHVDELLYSYGISRLNWTTGFPIISPIVSQLYAATVPDI